MAASRASASQADKVSTYNNQIAKLHEINMLMRETALASGDWHQQTVRTVSASQAFTQQLNKQNISMRQALRHIGEMKRGTGALHEAIREQQALRNAMATQMTGHVFGKNATDLYIPKNLGSELDMARTKYGMINQLISAAAAKTVVWGKNTQWAGRQITVGLTVPLGIAAVGAAALALKVDQNLTRIAKVYDTVNKSGVAQEEELARLRESSLQTATDLAQQYGQKMQDVLDIEAQLAATGLQGADLFRSTREVARIATLGEMEYQDAIDMTISLQTAFKLSNEELTESFNLMNAVENATSLSIQDIAEAVPRAASALSSLGGTVSEMTVMLVAMKEAGVDAAEGANALKSATTRLLNPTAGAKTFFEQTFGINLDEEVAKANGNIYELMNTLAALTRGYDDLDIQKGIAELFGTYQFNRINALWQNLGQAVTEGGNQTAAAIEAVGLSTEELANIADREMERWQNSIQGRFKTAVEGIKAQLVPLGETVLQFITPIMEFIAVIIKGFNEMNPVLKGIVLGLLGFGAVVGPLLMLVGIMANLGGNVIRFATGINNMRLKFKAMTAEEAAAAITAKNATSAFDTQAAAAANLTLQVQALTNALQQSMVAQGLVMSKSGQLIVPATGTTPGRVINRVAGTGKYTYGAGSRDAAGNPIAGHPASAADAAHAQQAWMAMQASSQQVAANATVTANKMALVRKAAAGLAIGALAITAMASGSNETLNTMTNILIIGTTLYSMGILTPMVAAAQAVWGWMKKWIALGAIYATQMKAAAGAQAAAAGGGLVGRLRAGVGLMGRLVSVGARFLGPVGLLAAGALIVKEIVESLGEAEDHQKALAASGKVWADYLGYTRTPGQLPGMTEDQVPDRLDSADVEEFTEANEELADALKDAAEGGHLYEEAMRQALIVLSEGGGPDAARKAFEMALAVGGKNPAQIKELLIEFDQVNLSNPEEVKNQIQEQLTSVFNDLDPQQMGVVNDVDSFWEGSYSGIRELFGGDLSDEARAAGTRLGALFGTAFNAAGSNQEKGQLFVQLKEQFNTQFESTFNEIDRDVRDELETFGINTADELAHALQSTVTALENGDELTDLQEFLKGLMLNDAMNLGGSGVLDFQEAYTEMIDTFVQGLVESGVIAESQADKIKESFLSIVDLQNAMDVPNPAPILTLSAATAEWTDYLTRAGLSGKEVSESEKLIYLNALRARAGLGAATSSTQGFGDAAGSAAMDAESLATSIENATYSAEQLAGAQRNAMSGAWNDIMAEADRQFQDYQNGMIDNIQAAGDARDEAIDRDAEASSRAFDAREKSLSAQWDAIEKNQENLWDSQTDAAENYWDARIKKVQDAIDAESKAEDERQRIFEAEQRRIQRMSQRFSSNIDLGVALNTGNLDEAAKIANDISAQELQWNSEDAQEAAKRASEKRKEALQNELDQINEAKDAALEALRERQDAEREALNQRRDMAEEQLRMERQLAEDGFAAQREANRKTTENNVKAVQDQVEADRRGLANRLRALQEFIPQNEQELRDHIAEIEDAYRDYGFDLSTQGRGWAEVIGTALDSNVAAAAAALQTDIKWDIIAKNIAAQIGEGMGMTMEQVVAFLKTGVFPAGNPVNAPRYIPPNANGARGSVGGRQAAFHSGGRVPYTGGKPYTQADRVGVPRSASTYPGEVPALLRVGEFIMNAKATAKNRSLLEALNNGRNFPSDDDHAAARHAGGLMDYAASLAALQSMAAMKVAQVAAMKKIEMARAAAAASYGGLPTGAMGGGNAGSGRFTPGGSWPAPRMGVVSPNTAGAVSYIRGRYPQITSIGTLGSRPNYSDHPLGKAADFMIPNWASSSGIALGDAVARFFVENPQAFGTKYVIWRKRITSGGGWSNYTHPNGETTNPTLNHYDHVHTSFLHQGGLANLASGGTINYGSGLSSLSTQGSSQMGSVVDTIRRGAANGGVSSNDTFVIDMRGSTINSDVDIERAVKKVQDARDSKLGRTRRIS